MTAGLACPKCDGQLVPRTVEEARLRECTGCAGVWAERGQLARLVRTEEDLRSTFPAQSTTDMSCPAGCDALLCEVAYSRTESNLLLDQCAQCLGLYLDSGELARVIDVNERIRELFGDGTFTGPPPRRSAFGRIFRRFFGQRGS